MPENKTLVLILLTAVVLSPAVTGDLLPEDTPISVAVDHAIDEKLQSSGLSPAPAATEEELLRRTVLDLAGRIPTTAEYEWYFQQSAENRRVQLIDQLLSLPDFDFHLRNSLDELLLPNRPNDGEFREYLLWAVRQQRPWNQMFRDMMLARTSDGPEKGAAQFLRSRVSELDDLTNDTSVLFFGVNVSCAKCHDHPLVADWKQDHFYGMQAFFSRTFATRKNVLTEKPFGEVKYRTTDGTDKTAPFMFLSGEVAEDRTPKFADDERKQLENQIRKLQNDENAGYILFPDFSPRQMLADMATKDDKHLYLAKNIVNRVWILMMGTGLVDPPDQMHSGNPPSHPDLLEWLARDMARHEYDLRRLIRGLALSDAYARSGQWVSADEPPSAQLFALAASRPLTPRQLSASLLIATRRPDHWPLSFESKDWQQKRKELEEHAAGLSREFEVPGENFQISVDEALFFSNNSRVDNDLLKDADDRISGWLKGSTDDAELASKLWITILGRAPADDEVAMATSWMKREDVDRFQSIRGLAWALLTGPEFRFNH